MTGKEEAARLLERFVLRPGERIVWDRAWDDGGYAFETDQGALFTVDDHTGRWTLGAAPWIERILIATPQHLHRHGAPYTHGLAIARDASVLHLNDDEHVSRLAARLHEGLDPLAIAEVIAEWQPWTGARSGVVTDPGKVRDLLPDIDLTGPAEPLPPRLTVDHGLAVLKFQRWWQSATEAGLDGFQLSVPEGGMGRWDGETLVNITRHSPTT